MYSLSQSYLQNRHSQAKEQERMLDPELTPKISVLYFLKFCNPRFSIPEVPSQTMKVLSGIQERERAHQALDLGQHRVYFLPRFSCFFPSIILSILMLPSFSVRKNVLGFLGDAVKDLQRNHLVLRLMCKYLVGNGRKEHLDVEDGKNNNC